MATSKHTLSHYIETAEVIVLKFGIDLEGHRVGGETPLTREQARHLASIYPKALNATGDLHHGVHGDGWSYGFDTNPPAKPRLVFQAR